MSQLALACPLILQIKRKRKEKEKENNNDLAVVASHDTYSLHIIPVMCLPPHML